MPSTLIKRSATTLTGRSTGSCSTTIQRSPEDSSVRARVIEFAREQHLPSASAHAAYARDGGLLSLGTDMGPMFRGAAEYVHRIIHGALPRELPVQRPTKFELVINLKTAKALGLTVPPSLLARADEVIE